MTWGIYLITNNVNDKKYVGMTNDLDRRQKEHWRELKGKYHSNKHLQNAITKYGIDNFDFFILLESYPNKKLIADLEESYITKWQLDNPQFGYNKTKGGEHNILNEEVCQKMSKIKREQWQDPKSTYNSNEYRKKLSLRSQGENNPMFQVEPWNKGKTGVYSEEVLEKMSEAHKGKHRSPATEFKPGKEHPNWKNYARVCKQGKRNGRQRFRLVYQHKDIKTSYNKDKLQKMANEINYCINMYGGI